MKLFEKRATKVSRREFLVAGTAVGGGLLLGFQPALAQETGSAGATSINPYQAYLRIDPDNTVTILSAHMEGGQGVDTGVATLLAEELGAAWAQIRTESVAGNPAYYGNMVFGGTLQITGGSTSMASSWQRYREAGAAARMMLIAAAAEAWGVPADEVTIQKGVIHSGDHISNLGDFARAAARQTVPEQLTLKSRADWSLIGNASLRRPDSGAKVRGQQGYTIDIDKPGMLTAVIQHPPRFGGTVKSVNSDAAKAMPGVVDVVTIPRGVAVVAETYWQALQARNELIIEWDESSAEKRGSEQILNEYRELAAARGGITVTLNGDGAAALAGAVEVIEAEFEFPYLAHAAMEPLNAAAQFKDGRLQLWGGLQIPDLYQQTAAQIMGIPPEKVQLHPMMVGGFFGRRATPNSDVISEVVSIVQQLGTDAPVKLQYSREDDMQAGYFRPMFVHKVSAGLAADGSPLAIDHQVVGQSIIKGTLFENMMMQGGIDPSSVEGADKLPYAIPNAELRLTTTDVQVPVLWWRSVGHTHTAYVVETVIDDMARAAGRDPLDYRRGLLVDKPRHLGVMNLAAEKSGWDTPLKPGTGRGLAVHESFGSYVAQVVEVTMVDGQPRVDRVVCAIDCGIAINPDTITAQMEGSIGFALGALLDEAITLQDGKVMESNYDGFPVLRINQMPVVEVHIVPSTQSPTGVGEPAVPPLGPAVANAIVAAGGPRIRKLPFSA